MKLEILILLTLCLFFIHAKKSSIEENPKPFQTFNPKYSLFYAVNCFSIDDETTCLNSYTVYGLYGKISSCVWKINNFCDTLDFYNPKNRKVIVFPKEKKEELKLQSVAPSIAKKPILNVKEETNSILGLFYDFHEENLSDFPDMEGKVPDFVIKMERLNFRKKDNLISFRENFGARFFAWIKPEESAEYKFCLQSDDGSKLFIKNVNDPSVDGFNFPLFYKPLVVVRYANSLTVCNEVFLRKGEVYPMKVEYFQAGKDYNLELTYSKADNSPSTTSLKFFSPTFNKFYNIRKGVDMEFFPENAKSKSIGNNFDPSWISTSLAETFLILPSLSLTDQIWKNIKYKEKFYARTKFFVDITEEDTYYFCLTTSGKSILYFHDYVALIADEISHQKHTKCKSVRLFPGYHKMILLYYAETQPFIELTYKKKPTYAEITKGKCDSDCTVLDKKVISTTKGVVRNQIYIEYFHLNQNEIPNELDFMKSVPFYSVNRIYPYTFNLRTDVSMSVNDGFRAIGFIELNKGKHKVCPEGKANLVIKNYPSTIEGNCKAISIENPKTIVEFALYGKREIKSLKIKLNNNDITKIWSYSIRELSGINVEFYIKYKNFKKALDFNQNIYSSNDRVANIDFKDFSIPFLENSKNFGMRFSGILTVEPRKVNTFCVRSFALNGAFSSFKLFIGKNKKLALDFLKSDNGILKGENFEEKCSNINIREYLIHPSTTSIQFIIEFSQSRSLGGLQFGQKIEDKFVLLTKNAFTAYGNSI